MACRKEVAFDTEERTTSSLLFHLYQEGGHRYRRTLHAGDITGKATVDALRRQVQVDAKPHIQILEGCYAIDLMTHPRANLHKKRYVKGASV